MGIFTQYINAIRQHYNHYPRTYNLETFEKDIIKKINIEENILDDDIFELIQYLHQTGFSFTTFIKIISLIANNLLRNDRVFRKDSLNSFFVKITEKTFLFFCKK